MRGARNIAVIDFGYPDVNKPVSIGELLKEAFAQLIHVQVGKEETEEMRTARCATAKTIELLSQTNYFTIINSADLSKSFSTDTPDQSIQATDIGKKSGAQSIVVGEIEQLTLKDENYTEDEKRKDGSMVKIDKVKRSVTLRVTYRVVSTENGSVLATKSLQGSTEQRELYSNRTSLHSKSELGCEILDDILPVMTKQLAPYRVTVHRILKKDKTKDLEFKQAMEFMEGKMYDKAYEIFTHVYQQRNLLAAGFNAAIMREALGDLEGSLTEMNALAEKTADKDVMKEVQRLKYAIEEQKRVKAQM
ncbi:MAG: hypothetical protein JW795_14120 [Chitinivibrionales bacterium]|nr:hypothetical protein [Chitinivibrionales bacterium]